MLACNESWGTLDFLRSALSLPSVPWLVQQKNVVLLKRSENGYKKKTRTIRFQAPVYSELSKRDLWLRGLKWCISCQTVSLLFAFKCWKKKTWKNNELANKKSSIESGWRSRDTYKRIKMVHVRVWWWNLWRQFRTSPNHNARRKKDFSFFGLFLQHEIYLIHAFVLCKFKPLPCIKRYVGAWCHFRLHFNERENKRKVIGKFELWSAFGDV